MCKFCSYVVCVTKSCHVWVDFAASPTGAYYPAQPQFTPSVQAPPVIMNPAPQQQPPPPQPPQHIPTKRERKQVSSIFNRVDFYFERGTRGGACVSDVTWL